MQQQNRIKQALTLAAILTLTGCIYGPESVEAGHEGVRVDKPYFFGHEGVQETPLETGTHWIWFSSSIVDYDIRPSQYNENFDDVITSDNTPVDFRAYVLVQPLPGSTPLLHKNFGPNWYKSKVQEVFRTMIRDFARAQPMFELTTNPAVTTSGEASILNELRAYIDDEQLPIVVNRVVIGGVTPPKAVLEETARTAAQEQRVRTEGARTEAEVARKSAETAKAEADLAYAQAFGLTPDQFLTYRSLEIQREMVEVVRNKDNVNVSIITGSGEALPTVRAGK